MSKRNAAKQRRLQAHQTQINRLTTMLTRLEAESQRLSTLRLILISVGLGASLLAARFASPTIAWSILLIVLMIFGGIVSVHRRLRQGIRRFIIWRTIKREQVARMTVDWDGLQKAASIPNSERTALEVDFDLVGERSLHRLMDTTVSAESSQRLRSWLNAGRADSAEITRRQALIRELAPLHTFRNTLILNARLVNAKNNKWDSRRLQIWLDQSEDAHLQRWLWLAIPLGILNAILFVLAQMGLVGSFWQISLLAYAAANVLAMRSTGQAFGDASYLRDALEELQAVFDQLEGFGYRGKTHLKALCACFVGGSSAESPSNQLRRVVRIVGGMGITMGNPIVAMLLHLLFPWHIFFTVQLNRLKAQLATQLPEWLDTWFELEALSALANFAYLNPHYQFPEQNHSVPYTATALGHPLLLDDSKVANSCTSGDIGSIHLITGSNMAGKSTFLRTVGINLVLAYAGTVVDAADFTFSPARLASCIRVSDSIADGFSYFYAEVRCLKGILDALSAEDQLPLIFFIDEIFRGTNNRERLIGSRSLIREMAGKHGIGLLSTHDLELVQLADEMATIRNYHFREEVVDQKMVFDYLLHEGPSPTTNALHIMKLAGLPVEIPTVMD